MKKVLVLGVIAALLSFGLILASCDSGGVCCDKDTWKPFADNPMLFMTGNSDLDKCCQTAVTNSIPLVLDEDDHSEAEYKKAVDCCYDAMVAAGLDSNL